MHASFLRLLQGNHKGLTGYVVLSLRCQARPSETLVLHSFHSKCLALKLSYGCKTWEGRNRCPALSKRPSSNSSREHKPVSAGQTMLEFSSATGLRVLYPGTGKPPSCLPRSQFSQTDPWFEALFLPNADGWHTEPSFRRCAGHVLPWTSQWLPSCLLSMCSALSGAGTSPTVSQKGASDLCKRENDSSVPFQGILL